MKYLFDAADRYLKTVDWKDMAVLKFCLLALGLMAGLAVPEKHKKKTMIGAGCVFALTYIPTMAKFCKVLMNPPVQEAE